MIGNDIIDLKAAREQCDPLRPRFLIKVFTKEEQRLIYNSGIPVNMAWILWAMKEAAYKAHQRRFKLQRIFNPKELQCEIWESSSTSIMGSVYSEKSIYYSRLSINNEYLHCTASANKNENILSEIGIGSKCSKQDLLITFSALLNVPVDQLEIKKNRHQVPFFSLNSIPHDHAFSLSHHGNYSAFSLVNELLKPS